MLLWTFTSPFAAAAEQPLIEWNPSWPRHRTWEWVATAALGAQAASAAFLYPYPDRNFRGGILFDESARDALRLRSRDDREGLRPYANGLYYGLAVYPFVVDTLAVTWGIHGSGDVAWQMFAMNLGSYALTGALSLTAQKLGRERPAARGCALDPRYSPKCGKETDLTQSFFSGHTGVTFTAAGLICAHHQHLPLYGGGAADTAACVSGIVAAAAQGVSRIATDDHYATDVLVGIGVGWFSGYVLPHLLHYAAAREKGSAPSAQSSSALLEGLRPVLLPMLSADRVGLTVWAMY